MLSYVNEQAVTTFSIEIHCVTYCNELFFLIRKNVHELFITRFFHWNTWVNEKLWPHHNRCSKGVGSKVELCSFSVFSQTACACCKPRRRRFTYHMADVVQSIAPISKHVYHIAYITVQYWQRCRYEHGRPQEFFQMGAKLLDLSEMVRFWHAGIENEDFRDFRRFILNLILFDASVIIVTFQGRSNSCPAIDGAISKAT